LDLSFLFTECISSDLDIRYGGKWIVHRKDLLSGAGIYRWGKWYYMMYRGSYIIQYHGIYYIYCVDLIFETVNQLGYEVGAISQCKRLLVGSCKETLRLAKRFVSTTIPRSEYLLAYLKPKTLNLIHELNAWKWLSQSKTQTANSTCGPILIVAPICRSLNLR
jgi:hypothetical protein